MLLAPTLTVTAEVAVADTTALTAAVVEAYEREKWET